MAFPYGKMRGQGSTEYLVLLAVVLVIGLVAISLISQPPAASESMQMESKAYWLSSSPISIPEFSQFSEGAGTRLSLTIQNSAPNYVVAYDFNISGRGANTVNSSRVYLMPGQSKSVNFTAPVSCSGKAGEMMQYDISLNYDQEPLYGKLQAGAKPLIVRCS